jgi:hypothetical protein
MNVKALKWTKLALYISGGGLSTVFAFLAIVDAKRSVMWIGAGAAVVGLAGAMGVLFPAPAQQVVTGAPMVTLAGTPTGATTVSTDSTLPISAPQKGAP